MSNARDRFDHAQRLYEHRTRLFHLVTKLPEDRLVRLRHTLDKLAPEDFEALESYAIGLAAWREPAQESPDAPQGMAHATPSKTGG